MAYGTDLAPEPLDPVHRDVASAQGRVGVRGGKGAVPKMHCSKEKQHKWLGPSASLSQTQPDLGHLGLSLENVALF